MILDKEEHRTFLLEMFKAAQFPGALLDVAFEVKQAIATAPLKVEAPKIVRVEAEQVPTKEASA